MNQEMVAKSHLAIETPKGDEEQSCSSPPIPQDSQESSQCPAPLGWKSVVKNVREQSEPFEVLREGHSIPGRRIGQGSPLYFLNGMGGSHELFSLVAWLLKEEFECVLFDYPSLRQNDGAKYRFTLDDLVLDLEAMRTKLKHSQVNLFASSFGGLVALKWMLEFPESIAHTVIQGGFAHRKLSLFEKLLVCTGLLLPGCIDRLPFREKVQQLNHRLWFPPFDSSRWQFFLNDTGKIVVKDEAQRANLIRKNNLTDRLFEIDIPVLLIGSEGDGIVSERCQKMLQDGLLNTSVERLANSGHIPFLTHPHRIAKLIRPFLTHDS